jgi:putative nucleotidyltransferase with HDIG domain
MSELTGREMMSIVAEPERGLVAENMRRLLCGEVGDLNYSTVYLRNDGSPIEIGVHGAIAKHDNRPAIIGLMQDISEKRRAEEAARRYVAQLENALMGTVTIATSLGEMRDPYTAGHERRVAEIAVAIGTELGFDAQRLEGLRVGGYLHDVGKMSIPSDILSKPAKLSAIEFALIKGHAQAGYDVLKGVKFPWPVAEMAWQHHERFDGSGYPRSLKGDEIILEARVLAVADVVEAMSSHRPYRPGLGIDKALEEIERGGGSAYDPVVADACLNIFRGKGFQVPSV